jgi:hypothetical protein
VIGNCRKQIQQFPDRDRLFGSTGLRDNVALGMGIHYSLGAASSALKTPVL